MGLILAPTVSAMGNRPETTRVPVQNQTQAQNQGEQTQLLIQTRQQAAEEQSQGTGSATPPGVRIRQLVQEHEQSSQFVQSQIQAASNRSGVVRFLIGPNFQAVKNMEKQMEQNQLRIQQLTELKARISNQADDQALTQAIQVMTEQNTALKDQISQQNQTRSLFGWLFRLFAK